MLSPLTVPSSSPAVPLHWYIHSLSAKVLTCRFQSPEGRVIKASSGLAHLEKNWGRAFPKAWVWAQGVTALTDKVRARLGLGLRFGVGVGIGVRSGFRARSVFPCRTRLLRSRVA